MLEERSIEINGLATRVFVAGQGPPLVYLHGTQASVEWWPLHERLAERFTVYAPDHPGFGATARPEWLEGMDDMVLHYDELFRALALERPVVVGFSLGGWIAAEFAVTYPDRVGALVLLNSAGLHVEGALIPDLPTLEGEALVRAVFYDRAAANAYFAGHPDRRDRMRAYRALTTLATLAWNPWFDPKLQRRLRRITAPTLVLWAEHDRLLPPVYAETYHAGIMGSQLLVVPECGHMLPVEQPEVVAETIAKFVAEKLRGGSCADGAGG